MTTQPEGHMFNLFDPTEETTIEYGRLPHWHQPGITYFITFRMNDSVPKDLMDEWQTWCSCAWLKAHGFPITTEPEQLPLPFAPCEFHQIFSTEFLEYLDRGHGACVLKRPELASLVMKPCVSLMAIATTCPMPW